MPQASTALAPVGAAQLVSPTEPLPPSLRAAGTLLEDLQAAGRLAERHIAPRTSEIYGKYLRAWEAYCASVARDAYPPETLVVQAWLARMAFTVTDDAGERQLGTGLAYRSISTALAALNKACSARGWQRPGDDPSVAEVMAGIRRTVGVAPQRQVSAIDATVMRDVLRASYQPLLGQLRDRALVLLHAHPDVRPGQLARLEWTAVDFADDAVTLSLPPLGRNGAPRPVTVAARGDELCVVAALRALRTAAGGRSPAVFCRTTRDDATDADVPAGPLSRHNVTVIARRWVERAGVALPESGLGELTDDHLAAAVAAVMAPRAAELRDRAMLLTAFYTAGRRSNVCALQWRHFTYDARRGVRVVFERSKSDQEAAGTEFWLPAGRIPQTCPIGAFRAWRAFVTDSLGVDPLTAAGDLPVFPGLDRHGNLPAGEAFAPMAGDSFARLVKRRVRAAGYDPAEFAGHSTRAGFITAAAEAGVPIHDIQQVSRHRNVDVLMGYIRRAEAWQNNPAAAIGL